MIFYFQLKQSLHRLSLSVMNRIDQLSNGINRLIDNINRLINISNRLMNRMNRLVNGIFRLSNGWEPGQGGGSGGGEVRRRPQDPSQAPSH